MARKENNKKKLAFGIISLVAAITVIVGVGYAYFSDVINGEGSATAGTLDITGTPSIAQNGDDVTGGVIANLNPGDVVTVDPGSIANAGSKSAWIRSVLEFTAISDEPYVEGDGATPANPGDLASYLWVCTGPATQSQLIAASNAAGGFAANMAAMLPGTTCTQPTVSPDPPADPIYYGAKDSYTEADDVISGSGANGEPDGSATWAPAAGVLPFIYFDAAATNDAQNGTMAFNILVQALQYRNNNVDTNPAMTDGPTEDQWKTVVTTPFSL